MATGTLATAGLLTDDATSQAAGPLPLSQGAAVAAGKSIKVDTLTDSAGTGPVDLPNGFTSPVSLIRLDTVNGHGSTNTVIQRFVNVTQSVGSAVTYADSATLGASFTINVTGYYAIGYAGCYSTATYNGISLNSAQLTTGIVSIAAADRLSMNISATLDNPVPSYWTGPLTAGDVIRPHDLGDTDGADPDRGFFFISKIG